MSSLFRTLPIEWMKVKYYRTFWILLAVIGVCIPAFNYVVYDITDNSFPKMNGKSILGNPFSFPNVWKTVPFNAGLLLFLPAILIITLLSNEYTYRTHRQNIIDGWSRSQFIFAKLFEVLLLSLLVTGIVFLTCIYFGFITKKEGNDPLGWMQLRFIVFFFVEMISYSTIAVLCAMLIRRAGLAMGIFFMYMIVEQFVVSIGRNKYKVTWVNYLPEEVTDRLIPQPFSPKMMGPDRQADWEKHIPVYLTISAVYLLIYCFIIIWRFRKTDL